jgi:hypothetical protein
MAHHISSESFETMISCQFREMYRVAVKKLQRP